MKTHLYPNRLLNLEERRERQRAYYYANREKRIASMRKWIAKNKARLAKKAREYYIKNKAYIIARCERYRKKEKERYREYARAYYYKKKKTNAQKRNRGHIIIKNKERTNTLSRLSKQIAKGGKKRAD
ncbi:MAG: hypothetical protein LBG16_00255 [Elusimicrobiota bacterium]|jgi:hypothetical protein|nr:hypothetical protein [Elusimicrobiota bacterium]